MPPSRNIALKVVICALAAFALFFIARSIWLSVRETIQSRREQAFLEQIDQYVRSNNFTALIRQAKYASSKKRRQRAAEALQTILGNKAESQFSSCKALDDLGYRKPAQTIVWDAELHTIHHVQGSLNQAISYPQDDGPFSIFLVNETQQGPFLGTFSLTHQPAYAGSVGVCQVQFSEPTDVGKPVAYRRVTSYVRSLSRSVPAKPPYGNPGPETADPGDAVFDWVCCGGILHAAEVGNLSAIKSILKIDRSVINSKDGGDGTPLHRAAIQDHKDAVALLLANGADINARGEGGRTPLLEAVLNYHSDVAELLLANKADVNAASNEGSTPLTVAVGHNYEDLVKLLLGSNAQVNTATRDSWTPLLLAVERGNLEIVELLLANGAEVSAQDEDGHTPLHLAVSKGYDEGHKKIAALLLAHKAEVGARDKRSCTDVVSDFYRVGGATPLHCAASSAQRDVVELLLTYKADANAKDNGGNTPLHYAAEKGNRDAAELLLAHGSDVNAKDNQGDTPLQWAVMSHEKDVAELLRQHGGHE